MRFGLRMNCYSACATQSVITEMVILSRHPGGRNTGATIISFPGQLEASQRRAEKSVTRLVDVLEAAIAAPAEQRRPGTLAALLQKKLASGRDEA